MTPVKTTTAIEKLENTIMLAEGHGDVLRALVNGIYDGEIADYVNIFGKDMEAVRFLSTELSTMLGRVADAFHELQAAA